MYEISTARTKRITTSTLAFAPSVYGDKIIYADCRNNPEIVKQEIFISMISQIHRMISSQISPAMLDQELHL
jgi:hypothetical protein